MNQDEFVVLFTDAATYIAALGMDGIRCELVSYPEGFAVSARFTREGRHYMSRSIVSYSEIFDAGSFRPTIDKAITANERYWALQHAKKPAATDAA